jgi:thioredoxin-like negative regulator of GroEL
MHKHLQKLAIKYTDVNFAKINVEKAKFFVNKLNIQVLPAVMLFVEGILKHKYDNLKVYN